MELRLRIVIAEHGHDEDNGARLLDAFHETFPEVGAVVSQNLKTGTLSTTFRIEGEDPFDAAKEAGRIFATAAVAADLDPSEILDVHVSPVGADARDGELQPA
jgi:hypothetical protein